MIINDIYSITRNAAGGFNLEIKLPGINEKTGKPYKKGTFHFYPTLTMVAAHLLEDGFPYEATELNSIGDKLELKSKEIGAILNKIFKE